MPVVVDTSVLAAYANRDDRAHERAAGLMRQLLRGEHGVPVGTDYVLDEGLTLIQRRTGRVEDARVFASYFTRVEGGPGEPVLAYLPAPDAVVMDALALFLSRSDAGLSFTDCVLIELAHHLEGVVATLDAGFEGEVRTLRA